MFIRDFHFAVLLPFLCRLKNTIPPLNCYVPKPDTARLLSSRAVTQLGVMVVDVQTGLFSTDPPPFEASGVIQRINQVTAAARLAGIAVVMVQHQGPVDGDWLVPATDSWKLHRDLVVAPGDLSVRKTTGDAFYKTDLEKQLRERGIESLVLAGYATEFCIDSTLRNAVSKEFEVFVVSDAHTTNDAPLLKAHAIRQYFNWVWGDSSSARGIHLLRASEIAFGQAPAGFLQPEQCS